jgi:hypothetical protein
MIIVVLRIISLIFLIFSIIVDINVPLILHTQVNQLIIGIIIISILLLVDEILGFLLGLTYLVIYFKFYQKKINNSTNPSYINLKEPLISDTTTDNDVKPISNNKTQIVQEHYMRDINGCIEMPYISNELLEKAQNNIYDPNNYNNYTEIQGLMANNNNTIQAFDNSSIDSYYSRL